MFKGWDEEQKKEEAKLNSAIEKAKEHRDHERLKKLLSKGKSTCKASIWTSETEKNHGRIEIRSCIALSTGALPSKEGWDGLKSIARIRRERIVEVVRDHLGAENSLHWRLDVHFKQDASRYRDRQRASNLGIIRKMVLNGLLKEKTLKNA